MTECDNPHLYNLGFVSLFQKNNPLFGKEIPNKFLNVNEAFSLQLLQLPSLKHPSHL